MTDEIDTNQETISTQGISSQELVIAQEIIDKFQTTLLNTVINATVWSSTNYPGYPNANETTDPWFPSSLLSAKDRGAPIASDLSPTIAANVLSTVCGNWAKAYSATRNFQWTRVQQQSSWGQPPHPGGDYVDTPAQWAGATISSMTSGYQQPAGIDAAAGTSNITPNTMVLAPGINSYIDQLLSLWNTSKTNTVTYTTYHCHNSCHNNCHGNRQVR